MSKIHFVRDIQRQGGGVKAAALFILEVAIVASWSIWIHHEAGIFTAVAFILFWTRSHRGAR